MKSDSKVIVDHVEKESVARQPKMFKYLERHESWKVLTVLKY